MWLVPNRRRPPVPNPLTRAQRRENAAFLKHLRRTGNVTEAAGALGLGKSRFQRRRRAHPAFAVEWEAALVVAHATFDRARAERAATAGMTAEPYIRRLANGRLQLRRAKPDQIDHAGRQRFLAALSASANVRLSATAAGFDQTSIYRERRRNPAFAREWSLALQMGYERLELALLESGRPETFAEDDWRRNDPPAIPQMTVNQVLQLMYLHQKEARLGGAPEPVRRRRGESREGRDERLRLMGEHRVARERERFRIAEAERLARGEPSHFGWEAEGHPLPDLSQVTGWSRATGLPPVDPDRALFGGWRIGDIPKGKRRG